MHPILVLLSTLVEIRVLISNFQLGIEKLIYS